MKLFCGCCADSAETDIHYEAPESLHSSFVFGYPAAMKKVYLKQRKAIQRESTREVNIIIHFDLNSNVLK